MHAYLHISLAKTKCTTMSLPHAEGTPRRASGGVAWGFTLSCRRHLLQAEAAPKPLHEALAEVFGDLGGGLGLGVRHAKKARA